MKPSIEELFEHLDTVETCHEYIRAMEYELLKIRRDALEEAIDAVKQAFFDGCESYDLTYAIERLMRK